MNEKMMKILGAVIAGFVVLILIILLLSSCSHKDYTFEELEQKMVTVAKNYYENNKDKLPAIDKDSINMTLDTMINDGKIDDLDDLFDEEVNCTGNVTITNNNGYFSYNPFLECGKKYSSTTLKDKIIKDSLVTEKFGLYANGEEYIMRGEVENNFLKINERLFRIIRINANGSIRVIEMDGLKQKNWDNRYNSETHYNSGLNEYEYNSLNSRIKDSIEDYYKDETIWTPEIKSIIETQDLCVGKRLSEDATKDGKTECSKKITNQTLGLIATYEFLQASLDKGCHTVDDSACGNYNWLADLTPRIWMITADAETSSKVFVLYGLPTLNYASSYADINTVFNISGNVLYKSGTGTEEDPYLIK